MTGQLAGLIMAAAMVMVFTFALGTTPYFPVQVIGSLVVGKTALGGFHFPAFLAGLILHQAVASLAWSLVFGFAVNTLNATGAAVAAIGLTVGVVSQIVDVELLGSLLLPTLHGYDLWAANVPEWASWASHVVFGLSFAFFPAIRKRMFPL
ncbi:MAG: hypothetical protein Q8O67_08295 [Deltaproteobacteria bacterium]|nr:hypothetical protein [Deltaproteobacteria bacterium]